MISAADERRHPAKAEPLWGESWYFDFAAPDGSFGGYVRLGLYPNLGVAWWWAHLVGLGRRLVLVRDHEVPLPRGKGLEVRSEGLWADLVCETAHEHWSIGMEAFGVALDDPSDAYRGELGERIPVGLDLEWETAGPVYGYPSGLTRYEQACMVHGEVVLGDERVSVDCWGERDHSWGVRDWWLLPWVWTAGRLDDSTAFHASRPMVDGLRYESGFVLDPAGTLVEIDGFSVETELGSEGLPATARMRVGPLALEVEPLAFAPVLLESPDKRVSRFPRALCRFSAGDGRTGVGWTEWNQPVAT